jgi:hypothetical protein
MMTIGSIIHFLLSQERNPYSIYWLVCSNAQAQRAIRNVRSAPPDQNFIVYAEARAGGAALLRRFLQSLNALPRGVPVIDIDLELLLQDLRCSAKSMDLSKATVWIRLLRDTGGTPERMESAIACLHVITTLMSRRLRFVILDNGNIRSHKRLTVLAELLDEHGFPVLDLVSGRREKRNYAVNAKKRNAPLGKEKQKAALYAVKIQTDAVRVLPRRDRWS